MSNIIGGGREGGGGVNFRLMGVSIVGGYLLPLGGGCSYIPGFHSRLFVTI